MRNTSTPDLIRAAEESRADAILLVFDNPSESATLGKLYLRIVAELRSRGILWLLPRK